MCGDVFFAVALADSLFFSAATSEARTKVLLYLLLTMAPFALVAPFIGPLLDRSRGGRRLMMVVINLLRGVVAFLLAKPHPRRAALSACARRAGAVEGAGHHEELLGARARRRRVGARARELPARAC